MRSSLTAAAGKNVGEAISRLQQGDHLCSIYRTQDEQFAVVVPFIQQGLEQCNEACLYIVDECTAHEVKEKLRQAGVDVAGALQSGQLRLLSKQDTYTRKGYFEPGEMLALLWEEIETAVQQGYAGLRVTGEMTWVLSRPPGAEHLLEYEARLNDFVHQQPAILLCQYNETRFAPDVLLNILRTHPLVVVQERVCRNFYYVPPEEFLQERQDTEATYRRYLRHMQEWEETEDRLLREVRKVQQRISELEELRRATLAVTSSLSRDRVLQSILQSAIRLVGDAQNAHVFLREKDELAFGAALHRNGRTEPVAFPRPNGLTAAVVRAGDPVVVADMEDHPLFSDAPAEWRGAIVGLPLSIGEQVVGVMNVATATPRPWIRDDLRVLDLLSDQAAIAIENARLYEQAQHEIADHRRTQQSLRASERRYRALFERTNDAVFIVGLDGVIQEANEQAGTLLGYERAELEGQRSSTFIHPEERERASARARQLLQGETLPVYERRFLHRDGREILCELNVALVRDEDGRPLHIHSLARDITERKEAEQEVRQRNRELRALNAIGQVLNVARDVPTIIDAALEHIVDLIQADGVTFCLRSAPEQRLLLMAHHGLDQAFLDQIEQSEACCLISPAALQEAFARQHPVYIDDLHTHPHSLLREDGVGYHSMLCVPVLGRAEPLGVFVLYTRQPRVFTAEEEMMMATVAQQIGVAIDQVRLFEAERKQRLRAEALQAAGATVSGTLAQDEVLEHILSELGKVIAYDTALVFLLREEQWTLAATTAVPELVGVSLSRDALRDVLPEAKQSIIIDNVDEHPLLLHWRDKVPAFQPLSSWMGIPLVVRRQQIGYLILGARPANAYSEQDASIAESFAQQAAIAVENARLHENLQAQLDNVRQAQTQLVQSEKLAAIGELIAGVAHELNNPIGSIVLYSQLLQFKEVDPDIQTDLKKIITLAQRTSRVVRSLLEFARQHPPERKAVQVNDVLRSALDLLAYELRSHSIDWTVRLEPDLPPTMADPHQLQQVVVNLINNAFQAMSETNGRGQLAVATETAVSRFPGNTTKKKERVIRIMVEDNGPGISPSLQSRIFDPFFTTKVAGQGTGLGLSVCHGIVQEHDGHIWVESEPGRGAIFYIELPLIEVEETVSPQLVKKETAVAPDLKQRILIADDEKSVREVMQRALQRQGYQVDAVATGSEALTAVRAAEYDLILCDIRMPGLNGMELYRQVKEEFPHLAGRFIFSTGDTVSPSTNAFLEEIDLPCLTKPFELPELFAVVHAAFQEEAAPSSS